MRGSYAFAEAGLQPPARMRSASSEGARRFAAEAGYPHTVRAAPASERCWFRPPFPFSSQGPGRPPRPHPAPSDNRVGGGLAKPLARAFADAARRIGFIAALVAAAAAAQAQSRDTVVETQLAPRAVKAQVRRALDAAQLAARARIAQAQRLIEAARASGDVRLLGYAEASLGELADTDALVLRATIEQSRHRFAQALELLDRALRREPDHLLALRAGAASCALRLAPPRYVRLDDYGYAQLDGRADCPGAQLALDYRLFEGIDPSHRVLLAIGSEARPRALAPGASIELQAALAAGAPRGFAAFVREGFGHILGGFDHVLFLIGLMLPAVVRREDGRWVARDELRGALLAVTWVATAFTLAHSLTLAAAVFGWIRISPRIIEPLIAATVLATALNNLRPVVTRRLAWVAFGFGLIHGFGFAEVLSPLALPRGELALALAGFNFGVELGQLAIVVTSFTLLAALRRWRAYPRWILQGGSAALALAAGVWIVERVFDVPLLPI